MKIINTFPSSRFFVVVAAMLATLSLARSASADSLHLTWDSITEPQVTGYLVHIGTQPGTYTQHVDVGPATSWSFTNAAAGQQYCFAVTAYVSESVEGQRSNEICGFSNAPPQLVNPGTQVSTAGQSATLQLAGSDPDGGPVTYSATGLPADLKLMASTGLISGTPTTTGSHSVAASVSDGVLTTSQTFTWVVNAGSSAPLQVGLTANRTAPQTVGTAIAFTATATGGQGPYQYKWWVYDGVNWTIAQNWTTNNAYTWQPTTANAAYRIGVWARNATTTSDTWNAAQEFPFAITAAAAPLQVGLTANRIAPQTVGTATIFTAAATGGQGPYQYKWWVFNGVTWTVLKNWSTSPTYKWRPTTANAAYRVGVWVRNATTTTNTWDASQELPFAIK